MRGQVSQGLVVSLSEYPEYSYFSELPEGYDLTDILNIQKFEEVIPEGYLPYPEGIPSTSIVRVQSRPDLLTEISGKPYIVTQKIDGMSSTFLMDENNENLISCGSSWSLPFDSPYIYAYQYIAKLYNFKEVLYKYYKELGYRIALQGEIYGPGIDGSKNNPLGVADKDFACYRVLVQDKNANWVDPGCTKTQEILRELEVPGVPVIEASEHFNYSFDQLMELSYQDSKGNPFVYSPSGYPIEGIVVKPIVPFYSEILAGDFAMKVISPKYLARK
jgi:hypothetical protein